MGESIISSRSSEPGRVCITGQLCKTLFLGHSRAFHTPQPCPTWSALPGSFPGLLTSHLAGVVTGAPPQGRDGGWRCQEDPDSCSWPREWGECVQSHGLGSHEELAGVQGHKEMGVVASPIRNQDWSSVKGEDTAYLGSCFSAGRLAPPGLYL